MDEANKFIIRDREPGGEKIPRFFYAEMRALDGTGNDSMRVEGYALKFDTETVIGDKKWGWRESIAKTALDSAELTDVVFTFNHNLDKVMARTTNGSLSLTVDPVGLKISADIIGTSDGNDLYRRIKGGLIYRMSFWAVVNESQWTFLEDSDEYMDVRVITAFGRFIDVSAVTFPAYEDTEIIVPGLEQDEETRQQQLDKAYKNLGGM